MAYRGGPVGGGGGAAAPRQPLEGSVKILFLKKVTVYLRKLRKKCEIMM